MKANKKFLYLFFCQLDKSASIVGKHDFPLFNILIRFELMFWDGARNV